VKGKGEIKQIPADTDVVVIGSGVSGLAAACTETATVLEISPVYHPASLPTPAGLLGKTP
jgi:aspartate oxidase